jgi:hypothetical protein
MAKTAHPSELANGPTGDALKTVHPAELAKTATPEALANSAAQANSSRERGRSRRSPAPRSPAVGAGRTPALCQTATPVSAEGRSCLARGSNSVRKSWHPTWHEQMWLLDGGGARLCVLPDA